MDIQNIDKTCREDSALFRKIAEESLKRLVNPVDTRSFVEKGLDVIRALVGSHKASTTERLDMVYFNNIPEFNKFFECSDNIDCLCKEVFVCGNVYSQSWLA